jgi:hypothetical protein
MIDNKSKKKLKTFPTLFFLLLLLLFFIVIFFLFQTKTPQNRKTKKNLCYIKIEKKNLY